MVQSPHAKAISMEIAGIHAAAYERDLTTPARTDITGDRVVCRLSIELTPADELLIDRGHHDAVHTARAAFQTTLTPAYSAAVERATGRTVTHHSSRTNLRAHVTYETFALARAAPALVL
jgi:uncharacterized protein YbcI